MKRIINIDGKLYIENASSNVICQDGCLYAQDDRWITVHADKEAGIKGQHVLIKEDGTVIGGLGGKLNGMKLSKVKGLQPPAASAIKIEASNLPSAYNQKRAKKNTEAAMKYINDLPDKDPQTDELYSLMGDVAQARDAQITVTHSDAKRGCVRTSASSTGESKFTIVTPVLQGKDPARLSKPMCTWLHENMHAMDYMLREDLNSYELYSANSEQGKKLTAVVSQYGYIHSASATARKKDAKWGDEVQKVFDDYAKSRTDSQKKYVEDIKPLQQEYSENSDKIRALYYEHKLSAGDTLKRLGELKKKYQEDVKLLQQKTDVPRQYAGMSNFMDLYDALGGGFFYGKNASTATGSYVPCSGHGSKYYSSYGNRNVELVANWGTLKMQNRKLVELFRKDKPEVAKALDEMLDDLLGRAKRLKRNGKS